MFKKTNPNKRAEGGIPAGVPKNRDDALFEALDKTKKTQADSTEETQAEESEDDTLDLSDFEDALNSISATEFTTEKPTEKEEIRVKLHLDNESFPEIEIILYRYDGTSCVAVIDGKSVSFVPRASVMELVESVQTIVLN